jgi:uncharacterized tellurite resistance protein B-like protein
MRETNIPPRQRLAVIELCASALTLLSPRQYKQFCSVLAQLIATDSQVDRLEWTVRVILHSAIEGKNAKPKVGARATAADTALIVSVLAWSGATSEEGASHAWRAACGVDAALPRMQISAHLCTLDALDESLRNVSAASPRVKGVLVDACIACVAADGQTTVEEAELLRAICAAIGTPMPPILAAA